MGRGHLVGHPEISGDRRSINHRPPTGDARLTHSVSRLAERQGGRQRHARLASAVRRAVLAGGAIDEHAGLAALS